jgi:tRNA (mo5U34)-methyltransferase
MTWYHTIDLPDGTATPGEYDLRGVVERLPIPSSLEGLRCLDVGSRDGFYAFELERRGAAHVVSLDIDDPADIDLPARGSDPDSVLPELERGNQAFAAAREALGSSVERRLQSVYSLDRGEVGRFDLAVLGTLLHHLRDPVGALTSLRRVLDGRLLIVDAITVGLSTIRRRPVAEMLMRDGPFWWAVNPAGLRRMAEAAGFEVIETGKPFLIPYGAGAQRPSVRSALSPPLHSIPARLTLTRGAPHTWLLASGGSEPGA